MFDVPTAVIERALDYAIRVLIEKYDELGMRASGTWANELEGVAETNKGIIRGVDYTQYLTLGRPPNSDQSPEAKHRWVGWAGSTFIAQWVKDKGLNISPYAVAGKIANEGTDWYPQGSDLLEVLESDTFLSAFYDIIGEHITVQITEELQRDLQSVAA